MNLIVEVNQDGALYLPTEILKAIAPHTRFAIELKDKTIILYPEQLQLFWATATPEERAEDLMQWVLSHQGGPNLPDEALRRENMYD